METEYSTSLNKNAIFLMLAAPSTYPVVLGKPFAGKENSFFYLRPAFSANAIRTITRSTDDIFFTSN